MRKRKKFVNLDKSRPKSKKFFFVLNLLMSSTTMINSWVKILKSIVMLICKIWAMMNKSTNKSLNKRKKSILITILNVCNKTWKNFTKLEKQSFKKNKIKLEKREKLKSKESKKDIKTKKKNLNPADLGQEITKPNKNRMTRLKKLKILRLIIKSSLITLWLNSMMMITTFQIMMMNLITTKTKKLIQMKSWMVNYLMMTLMSFQNLCLIWKKEENLLKRLN